MADSKKNKKNSKPTKYMSNVRASVQLKADGLHVKVKIPWEKFKRLDIDVDEIKKKYNKGRKQAGQI